MFTKKDTVLELLAGREVTLEIKREIAKTTGSSIDSINYHIWALRKEGKIKLAPKKEEDSKRKGITTRVKPTPEDLVDLYVYLMQRSNLLPQQEKISEELARSTTKLKEENLELTKRQKELEKENRELSSKVEELNQLNLKIKAVQSNAVVLHGD